jgi:hypothetical protein
MLNVVMVSAHMPNVVPPKLHCYHILSLFKCLLKAYSNSPLEYGTIKYSTQESFSLTHKYQTRLKKMS